MHFQVGSRNCDSWLWTHSFICSPAGVSSHQSTPDSLFQSYLLSLSLSTSVQLLFSNRKDSRNPYSAPPLISLGWVFTTTQIPGSLIFPNKAQFLLQKIMSLSIPSLLSNCGVCDFLLLPVHKPGSQPVTVPRLLTGQGDRGSEVKHSQHSIQNEHQHICVSFLDQFHRSNIAGLLLQAHLLKHAVGVLQLS